MAVEARHHEIRHDDGRPEGGDLLPGVLAVDSRFGVESPRPDELGETAASGRVILDDQHTLFAHTRTPNVILTR
jgi:hypothetical protein